MAAEHYGFGSQVATFSGGTEATAFNARAVAALRRAGLAIESGGNPENPDYTVSYGQSLALPAMFSKKYGHAPNPETDCCAVMVCSQADEACPLVRGASARVSLPYQDPKNSDGKPGEAHAYDQTCRLIAGEAFYVFDYVQRKMNQ